MRRIGAMSGAPTEYLRSLTSGYSAAVRAKKLLTVLQAYIDDSASSVGDRRFFLAGYVSTADAWVRFSDAWEEELKATPTIGYLKMSEAKALRGEFHGWNGGDRDEKVRRLGGIIRRFRPNSLHCSVSCNDIDRLIKPVAPYGFANPYYYCFQGIMMPIAARQAKEGFRVPIDFIFDDQGGLGDETRYLYRLVREQQPKEVRDLLSIEPLFRDDKLILPLQAADMLAWHVRRQAEGGETDEWFVPSFMAPPRAMHIAIDVGSDYFEQIANGFREIPGAQRLKAKTSWKAAVRRMQELSAAGFVFPHGSWWKNAVYKARKGIARFIRL